MARDLHAEVDAAFDAAAASLRPYGDAILAEAERHERMDRLRGKAQEETQADLARRFPALAARQGLPGGGVR